MTYQEFKTSLIEDNPKSNWPICLKALWYDAKDNWTKAHDLVNEQTDLNSKWVHAYLHRKEGDAFNAGYWYSQSGKPTTNISLEDEFRVLLNAFLSDI